MNRKYKIAFASCGAVTSSLAEYFRGLNAELSAIADPDASRREKLSSYYRVAREYDDYREMLARERPDLVICAKDMSEGLDGYFQMAKDCLLAGAWAYVERPVAMSPEQAGELIDLQAKTGCYVSARFQRRQSTAYMLARNIVQSEEFGKPLLFSMKGDTSPYASELDFIDKHLSHFFDLATMFFDGLRITHVSSLSPGANKYGYQISLEAAGAVGIIQSVSFQTQDYPIERMEILSDGKAVVIENGDVVHYMRPSSVDSSLSPVMKGGSGIKTFMPNRGGMTTASNVRYKEFFGDLLECISKGKKPDYAMEQVLPAVTLLDEFRRKIL